LKQVKGLYSSLGRGFKSRRSNFYHVGNFGIKLGSF
jgi:hypothetical protein